MTYIDPNTIHNPATGTVAPAAWGDVVRDDLEFLIDPPACSVFHNTTQSLVTATLTVLSANSEFFDNDAMHSTVTNNSRITIQTAGRYLVLGVVRFATSGAGNARLLQFLVNGTTQYEVQQVGGTSTAARDTLLSGSRLIVLAAADYVEVRARQDTGGNLATNLEEFGATFITR